LICLSNDVIRLHCVNAAAVSLVCLANNVRRAALLCLWLATAFHDASHT
jgi:hypothetical protein